MHCSTGFSPSVYEQPIVMLTFFQSWPCLRGATIVNHCRYRLTTNASAHVTLCWRTRWTSFMHTFQSLRNYELTNVMSKHLSDTLIPSCFTQSLLLIKLGSNDRICCVQKTTQDLQRFYHKRKLKWFHISAGTSSRFSRNYAGNGTHIPHIMSKWCSHTDWDTFGRCPEQEISKAAKTGTNSYLP